MNAPNLLVVVTILIAVVVLIFLLMVFVFFVSLVPPWMSGFMSGVPVSIVHIVGMRFRGERPALIIDTLIALVHRGHKYDRHLGYLVESTHLAQRGMVESAAQLADAVERRLKEEKAAATA